MVWLTLLCRYGTQGVGCCQKSRIPELNCPLAIELFGVIGDSQSDPTISVIFLFCESVVHVHVPALPLQRQ